MLMSKNVNNDVSKDPPIAKEVRSAELAITSLISNKREWNNCFIKFLKYQKFEVQNMREKSEKIRAKLEKNLMKMRSMLYNILWSEVGSSQKKKKKENTSCLFAYF